MQGPRASLAEPSPPSRSLHRLPPSVVPWASELSFAVDAPRSMDRLRPTPPELQHLPGPGIACVGLARAAPSSASYGLVCSSWHARGWDGSPLRFWTALVWCPPHCQDPGSARLDGFGPGLGVS